MNIELIEMNIREAWRRIVTSVTERGGTNEFHPPASNEQIAELESKLGIRLPYSLSSFLKCQNGCIDYFDQIIVGTPFLSTEEIERDWATNCEVDEDSPAETGHTDLSDLWWHKRCIPIAGSDGDCVCIDAQTNSIYSHYHGMGGLSGPDSPSLVEWLSTLANRIESGQGEIVEGKLSVEHW